MSKRSPFFHLFLDQTVMQSCSSAKFIGQLGNNIWYNVQRRSAWCMRGCALGSIVLSIPRWNLLFFKKSAFFDKTILKKIHLASFWEKIFLRNSTLCYYSIVWSFVMRQHDGWLYDYLVWLRPVDLQDAAANGFGCFQCLADIRNRIREFLRIHNSLILVYSHVSQFFFKNTASSLLVLSWSLSWNPSVPYGFWNNWDWWFFDAEIIYIPKPLIHNKFK
jgi:hypothetical protein